MKVKYIQTELLCTKQKSAQAVQNTFSSFPER